MIADAFERTDIERIETGFADAGFLVQKKEVITFMVKHAMQLDKSRVEKMISQISSNQVVVRVLRNFLGSGESSKAYEELQKNKDYICYVLKR